MNEELGHRILLFLYNDVTLGKSLYLLRSQVTKFIIWPLQVVTFVIPSSFKLYISGFDPKPDSPMY
jgi:hypothetical protein